MYALIHNNQIQVGPRDWLYPAFREYLEENSLDYSMISRAEPTNAIITPEYKILPVYISDIQYDNRYEELVGPELTIQDDSVVGSYSKKYKSEVLIKNVLKSIIAEERYKREVSGTSLTIQGTEVKVYTTREDRNTYLQAYQLSDANSTYEFKFPLSGGIFLSLSQAELLQIVQAVVGHVQSAFAWEKAKNDEIDAVSSVTDLKNIVLTYGT